ncbi:MAG: DUF721 domain-containing protein [Melioribacteraceae bacterium]|nr:DUF721 domain-containing protein [Melioribacteraceae bacterium]
MYNSFKSVSDVFSKEDAFKKMRSFAKEADVIDQFPTIFPELKNVAKVKRIEKGVLFLKVSNSVWRNELKFKSGLIIEKINHHFIDEIVKSVRFTA